MGAAESRERRRFVLLAENDDVAGDVDAAPVLVELLRVRIGERVGVAPPGPRAVLEDVHGPRELEETVRRHGDGVAVDRDLPTEREARTLFVRGRGREDRAQIPSERSTLVDRCAPGEAVREPGDPVSTDDEPVVIDVQGQPERSICRKGTNDLGSGRKRRGPSTGRALDDMNDPSPGVVEWSPGDQEGVSETEDPARSNPRPNRGQVDPSTRFPPLGCSLPELNECALGVAVSQRDRVLADRDGVAVDTDRIRCWQTQPLGLSCLYREDGPGNDGRSERCQRQTSDHAQGR